MFLGSCVIIFFFKSFYHLAPFLSNDFSADGMFFVHGISRFEGQCAGFSWGFKCFLLASDLAFYSWALFGSIFEQFVPTLLFVCRYVEATCFWSPSSLKENSEYSRGFCCRMFLFSYPRVWFCATI